MGLDFTTLDAGRLFALLGFVPGALGQELNSIRQQLVPACPFKSHVTLLPPRVLNGSASDLSTALDAKLLSVEAFEIGLGKVEIFPASGVIYLGIESGFDALQQLHDLLARDEFEFDETYPFHPHVTLAQDFPLVESEELVERAVLLWNSWQGKRSFVLEHASFVRGLDLSTWETLSEHHLYPILDL